MNRLVTLVLAIVIAPTLAAGQSTQSDATHAVEPQTRTSASAPKSQKVYHVGGDVKAPRAIWSSQPQLDEQQSKKLYAGKKVKRTGSTMLKIVVGDDGTVRSAAVFESFDHDLDAKAIEAVKQWKFEPATRKGVPVAVELMVKVDFRLYK